MRALVAAYPISRACKAVTSVLARVFLGCYVVGA